MGSNNGLSSDDPLLSNIVDDATCNENFMLEKTESHLDDINSCLTVSSMASDSVIKGIVNAATREDDEILASRKEELEELDILVDNQANIVDDIQATMGLGNGLSSDDLLLSNIVDDTTCNEDFILEDLDSYLDDINSRLTVSRMVSDSVIKGIVSAVTREADEVVASRKEEVDILHKKLKYYESVIAKEHILPSTIVWSDTRPVLEEPTISAFPFSFDEISDRTYREAISELKVAADEQLKRLKKESRMGNYPVEVNSCSMSVEESTSEKYNVINECADALEDIIVAFCQKTDDTYHLSKMLLSKQQWEHNLQKEITTIIIQNMTLDAQERFWENPPEHVAVFNSFNTFNKNCQKAAESVVNMRQDLEAFSVFLYNSEVSLMTSHHKSLDELGEHRKDHAQSKVDNHLPQDQFYDDTLLDSSMDSEQLKCMPKDDIISYYKDEMMKMKREHDQALQEKTEELFAVKREFLKDKGSSPLNFKREKEYEQLKKKITAFLSTMEHIFLENRKLWAAQNRQVMLECMRQKSESVVAVNQQHQPSPVDYKEKILSATQQQNFLEVEESFSEHSKKLRMNIEDANLEAKIASEIHKTVLTALFDELQVKVEDLELERKTLTETCLTIYREHAQDATVKLKEENKLNAELLQKKEKVLLLKMEENKKLKEETESLRMLTKEKDKLCSETEFMLTEQKRKHDLLCHELDMLKDQLRDQALLISDYKEEYHLAKCELDEALQQIHIYKAKISTMDQNFKVKSDALAKAEKQESHLHGLLEEKHREITSAQKKEKEHVTSLKSMMTRITQLIFAVSQFEASALIRIESNESRLNVVKSQLNELGKLADVFRRKAFCYKQKFEIKCSDLEKAETEVDLLGDEVETLLRLLERIYIALEHYSPILQHYPGVMEILKLIRSEMKKKTSNKLT